MKGPWQTLFVVALVSSTLETSAAAQELRYSPEIDLPVTIGGLTALAVAEGLTRHLVLPCRWCDTNAAGEDTLNGLDRAVRRARWSHPGAAAWISDGTAFVGTPLAAGGFDAVAANKSGRGAGLGTDLLVIAEAGVIAADLNAAVKLLVLRERPYAHAARVAGTAFTATPNDTLSFYSGHTTETMSLAVAAGTVASLRGYRLAPLVWAGSMPMPVITGYLRIAADRHYFTDVLVGALTGALVGALVPFVFHRPTSETALDASNGSVSPQPASVVAWSGVW